MEESLSPPCSCHKTPCSCRKRTEIKSYIHHVKKNIEICFRTYKSLEETMKHLEKNHQITPRITKLIWEKLEEESPEFFRCYYKRCETASQTRTFNHLFAKQISWMLHAGIIDLSKAKPELVAFLSKHSYGVRIMEYLAKKNAYMPEAVSPNSALYVPNGSTATQLHIPNNQQNHYQLPTLSAIPYNNCFGAPTIRPSSTTSQRTYRACIGASVIAQAATAPLDPSGFPHLDTDQLRQSNIPPHELEEQYQMLMKLQPNISQVEHPTLPNGISNCSGYAEVIDQQFNHNFGPPNQSMQMYTNVDQQKAGVVMHCSEEPELSSNQLPEQQLHNKSPELKSVTPENDDKVSTSTGNQPKRRRFS